MTPRRLISILLPWLLIAVIGLLAAWLRYGFIEQPVLAHMCDDINHSTASCGVRTLIVLGFNSYSFGIAALVATVLALMLKKPLIAWLAAALGMFALIMYCYYAGAVALLIGCLHLLRLQVNHVAAPRHQHRNTDRQVQAKP